MSREGPERPCPFCGATALKAVQLEHADDNDEFQIQCSACGANSGPARTLARAVGKWDTRWPPVLPKSLPKHA